MLVVYFQIDSNIEKYFQGFIVLKLSIKNILEM